MKLPRRFRSTALALTFALVVFPLALMGCGGSGGLNSSSTSATGTTSVTATAESNPPAASVAWTAANLTTTQSFVAYNLYRDGKAIATLGLSATTFIDSSTTAAHTLYYTSVPNATAFQPTQSSVSVAPVALGVSHTYTVSVVYIDTTTPGQTIYYEATLGTSAAVTLTATVTTLGTVTATASGSTKINIVWTASPSVAQSAVLAYNVYRDNAIVGSTTASALTFTDTVTTTTQTLTYFTVATGSSTGLTSQTVSVMPLTTGAAHTYMVTEVYLDSSVTPALYHEIPLGTSAAITLPGS